MHFRVIFDLLKQGSFFTFVSVIFYAIVINYIKVYFWI